MFANVSIDISIFVIFTFLIHFAGKFMYNIYEVKNKNVDICYAFNDHVTYAMDFYTNGYSTISYAPTQHATAAACYTCIGIYNIFFLPFFHSSAFVCLHFGAFNRQPNF